MMTTMSRSRSRGRIAALAAFAFLPGAASAQVLGPPPAVAAIQPAASSPAADWHQVLADLKLVRRGEPVRKKHHTEVDATTVDGRRVTASFDLEGRIWEVEIEDHRKPYGGDLGSIDPRAAVDAARRAGFRDPALAETKRNHTVIRARTERNEAVELDVDRQGTIYRQVWLHESRRFR